VHAGTAAVVIKASVACHAPGCRAGHSATSPACCSVLLGSHGLYSAAPGRTHPGGCGIGTRARVVRLPCLRQPNPASSGQPSSPACRPGPAMAPSRAFAVRVAPAKASLHALTVRPSRHRFAPAKNWQRKPASFFLHYAVRLNSGVSRHGWRVCSDVRAGACQSASRVVTRSIEHLVPVSLSHDASAASGSVAAAP
jgi:hypothetical protein